MLLSLYPGEWGLQAGAPGVAEAQREGEQRPDGVPSLMPGQTRGLFSRKRKLHGKINYICKIFCKNAML